MSADDLELRAARSGDPDERAAIIALLAASLGRDDDPRFADLYAWKHEQNAFGPSPAWVAVDGDRIVGIRVFLRWEFVDARRSYRAVRAVDTATHPDYQGRGIFTRLTRHGLDAMADPGFAGPPGAAPGPIDFVFNTPNEQSRPGYLKLGWRQVGRLPVSVRPRGPGALLRMATAKVPAERWSEPTDAAEPAAEVLADTAALTRLLAAVAPPTRLRTAHRIDTLRWRYATPLLHYRAVSAPGGPDAGLAIFRVRRRGPAREAALVEVIVPDGSRRTAAGLVRAVRRAARCDYVIALGTRPPGFVGFPRQGPILTWREVGAATDDAAGPDRAAGALGFTLGDIELF